MVVLVLTADVGLLGVEAGLVVATVGLLIRFSRLRVVPGLVLHLLIIFARLVASTALVRLLPLALSPSAIEVSAAILMVVLLVVAVLMRGIPLIELTVSERLLVPVPTIIRRAILLLWLMLSRLAVFLPLGPLILPSFLWLLLSSGVGVILESVLVPFLEEPGFTLHLPIFAVGRRPSVIIVAGPIARTMVINVCQTRVFCF